VQATLNRCQAASLTSAQATARVTKPDHDVMLWTIAIILLVLWLIGWVGFHVLGAAIHILVILAIIFIVVALVKGM
jgi:preprotein translocase subunit Sss1